MAEKRPSGLPLGAEVIAGDSERMPEKRRRLAAKSMEGPSDAAMSGSAGMPGLSRSVSHTGTSWEATANESCVWPPFSPTIPSVFDVN